MLCLPTHPFSTFAGHAQARRPHDYPGEGRDPPPPPPSPQLHVRWGSGPSFRRRAGTFPSSPVISPQTSEPPSRMRNSYGSLFIIFYGRGRLGQSARTFFPQSFYAGRQQGPVRDLVRTLFQQVPERYGAREGGYTRIIRTMPRKCALPGPQTHNGGR